ncbi:S-adenosyl-L-methionine-dependentmethyltransferases superfamily protein, partial [Striga asiatica]
TFAIQPTPKRKTEEDSNPQPKNTRVEKTPPTANSAQTDGPEASPKRPPQITPRDQNQIQEDRTRSPDLGQQSHTATSPNPRPTQEPATNNHRHSIRTRMRPLDIWDRATKPESSGRRESKTTSRVRPLSQRKPIHSLHQEPADRITRPEPPPFSPHHKTDRIPHKTNRNPKGTKRKRASGGGHSPSQPQEEMEEKKKQRPANPTNLQRPSPRQKTATKTADELAQGRQGGEGCAGRNVSTKAPEHSREEATQNRSKEASYYSSWGIRDIGNEELSVNA